MSMGRSSIRSPIASGPASPGPSARAARPFAHQHFLRPGRAHRNRAGFHRFRAGNRPEPANSRLFRARSGANRPDRRCGLRRPHAARSPARARLPCPGDLLRGRQRERGGPPRGGPGGAQPGPQPGLSGQRLRRRLSGPAARRRRLPVHLHLRRLARPRAGRPALGGGAAHRPRGARRPQLRAGRPRHPLSRRLCRPVLGAGADPARRDRGAPFLPDARLGRRDGGLHRRLFGPRADVAPRRLYAAPAGAGGGRPRAAVHRRRCRRGDARAGRRRSERARKPAALHDPRGMASFRRVAARRPRRDHRRASPARASRSA